MRVNTETDNFGPNGKNNPGGSGPDRSRRFDFLLKALDRTPISVFYQTQDLIFRWAENLPDGIAEEQVLGRLDGDFLPPLAAQRLVDAKLSAIETGVPQRFEVPITLEEEVRWFDTWIDPDINESNGVQGVFTTMLEVTEQKRHEVQLRNLLREVSHRSKNLLAIILSLATQTARNSTSIGGFIGDFSGRLQAIARAQDLVTDRDWQGASLNDLVIKQVALFRSEVPVAVRISGRDRVISPSAAIYVGLAIHELAAHASRTGAWRSGPIAISIGEAANDDSSETVILEWKAKAAAQNASFNGLSKRFLESVVPIAVDGTGSIYDGGNDISYRLSIGSAHIG
ncbi:sensor histidine kinase [Pelagibacterium limicola]|uniref:sensor histidine kinase n=1 Tax=Pelagibacterium limicola TaxID=2791022 RepID=UPI0018AFEAA9|nr:PAS domain-containing sensor histidine kinase [Pelagibacterium limicola]